MKIGFDAKRYFHNHTGLGNYSRDLVDAMIQKHQDDRFFLFDKHPEIDHLPFNVIAVAPQSNIQLMWREWGIRHDIKRYMLDVYHGLSNELPYGKWRTKVKKVVTIHDVIFRHFPEHYKSFDRSIYHKKTQHAIDVADVIVSTSHTTAKDLIQLYHADEKKLHVVYQTCGDQHRLNYDVQDINLFKSRKRLPERFILYVSSFQKRKNHLALLQAFAACKGDAGKLVLAGKSGETLQEVKQFIQDNGLEQYVIILNDIGQAELPLLYRSATGFVYPSMIEGFGIPLVEAANAGLPMAVNDIAIFNELASPQSIKFKADDVLSFSTALKSLSRMEHLDYTEFLKSFDPIHCSEEVYKLY